MQLLPPARLLGCRDVPLSYEMLRGSAEQYGAATCRRVMGADYSAGVIAYNWSVDRRVDQLLHHNVFLSGGCGGGQLPEAWGSGPKHRGGSRYSQRFPNQLRMELGNLCEYDGNAPALP